MSELAVLRSGVDGLDILLGGGFRPFARGHERASLTVLVRGPAGSGKTILAAGIAIRAASERGGHVAYGCVELLPEELKAQLAGIQLPMAEVFTPPFVPSSGTEPGLFAGLLDSEGEQPLKTLLSSLDAFADAVGDATVLVIDSVSTGYGLAGAHQRQLADAVCKLSAGRGLFTIVIEEADGQDGSPWPFATDVVIELRRGEDTRRELWVSKNRTGPAEEGWTRFRIEPGLGVVAMPSSMAFHGLLASPRRASIPLESGSQMQVGEATGPFQFGAAAEVWSISGEGPFEAPWIASQLVASPTAGLPGGTPPEVHARFAGARLVDTVTHEVDGFLARSAEEFVSALVATALTSGPVAPIVRIDNVHVGAQLLGADLSRQVVVAADVLRRAGCQVLISGLPAALALAADARIRHVRTSSPIEASNYQLVRSGRNPVPLRLGMSAFRT